MISAFAPGRLFAHDCAHARVGPIALLVGEVAKVALGAENRRNHIGLAEGAALLTAGS